MASLLLDKSTFLNHKKAYEDEHQYTDDPISSILSVEINTTELCNRKCVFCPRYDSSVYPNQNLNMDIITAETIAVNLKKHNYSGKISFSGFGENFLNKLFPLIINIFRQNLPYSLIECNTNGDFLTRSYADNIFNRGLDYLYINLYDGVDQISKFDIDEKWKEKIKFRAHYSEKDYGLFLQNRAGSITWIDFDEDLEEVKNTECYYPFYKLFVDWNGDVLFCSNDWMKEHIVGNLVRQTLKDVWMNEELKTIRLRLANKDRSISPCNKCSIHGRKYGSKSYNLLLKHYEHTDIWT